MDDFELSEQRQAKQSEFIPPEDISMIMCKYADMPIACKKSMSEQNKGCPECPTYKTSKKLM